MASSGFDGSDFEYRQTISKRYMIFPALRRTIKRTAVAQVVFVAIRTAWKGLPSVTEGAPFSMIDQGIAAGAAALLLVYLFAFGLGKPQCERPWAIKLYCVGSMLLLAECVIMFWAYHVLHGPASTDPQLAAAYPPIPRIAAAALQRCLGLGAAAGAVAQASLGVAEKAVDVAGIVVCAYGAYSVREYVSEQKQQREEAKGQGGKAE